MKPYIAVKFLFIVLLACNSKFNPTDATKINFLDQIDATKIYNMSTFSFQCQDQMVKVGSDIYHLDRFRSSLKSVYFEKLFTSDEFKQKHNPILEIQPLNSEVFPAVVDLIYGKELSDVLKKENYLPLLETMDNFGMEIDLKNFSNFMEQNLTSYSLQEAKIFQLYNFIVKNAKFEYLLKNVFKHFANDLTTLQNHTIFLSLPLDHLIRIINEVEHPTDKKRQTIIQICTEWLCHDMENRLFHMANLVSSIKSSFHSSIETDTSINKCFPKHDFDEQTKRKYISRCLFALLANKNLDPKKLDGLKPDVNLKSFSPRDAKIFDFYNFVKNDGNLEHFLETALKHFANNLTILQDHELFLSLPYDHLVQIIKNIQEPNNEKRYKIIQMCTEWLCHDMENRLPHLLNLVISAKSLFHSSIETNTDVRYCLPRCLVDEKLKRKIISRCLFALLTHDEHFNPKMLTDDESNYHSDDGYYSEVDERKSYDDTREYMRVVNHNDEYAKLKKFLNNSDFYDITIRVGEKTFKLHRVILESKCGYFKNIFQIEYLEAIAHCHGPPTCPSKDKEYLINDQLHSSTLDAVIDFIYFGNFSKYCGWSEMHLIVRIFVTVDTLEIQDGRLLEYCKKKLMNNFYHKEVRSEDIIQILNCVHGETKHDDLYLFYLCKHISTAKWPDIYNVSHFFSISWIMLENMLKSPHFHLGRHKPQKIMHICSKWICHDVKNRYQYLSRIAQIINPLCVVDHDKYTTDVAAELNDFSQQSVKDKLWEILSLLQYNIPSPELSKKLPRKLKEIPAFIAPESGKMTIDIFNVDLNLLESFNVTEHGNSFYWSCDCSKATLIGENLFVLSEWDNKKTFLVYNLALKKYFPLRFHFDLRDDYNLLNCKNEVYGYSKIGRLMKYSMQFNRWITIWKPVESNKDSFRFTSNGESLYRTREHSKSKYIIEAYNFEKNSWHPVPNLPIMDLKFRPHQLAVVNDHDFAVSIFSEIVILHRDSMTWSRFRLPDSLLQLCSFISLHENRILFVAGNKFARFFPSNKSFVLMEGLPVKYKGSYYARINAIHRIVRTNQLLCDNFSRHCNEILIIGIDGQLLKLPAIVIEIILKDFDHIDITPEIDIKIKIDTTKSISVKLWSTENYTLTKVL